jgi:hypothetical protein
VDVPGGPRGLTEHVIGRRAVAEPTAPFSIGEPYADISAGVRILAAQCVGRSIALGLPSGSSLRRLGSAAADTGVVGPDVVSS